MHPIAPRSTHHAALLALAGMSPLRPRALPGPPITAQSGESNYFFQIEICLNRSRTSRNP